MNDKGINYLREKRIETMRNSQDFNQVDNEHLTSIATPIIATENTDYINLLKEQLEDLKKEKDYWRNEYTKKDTELKEKNEYIQGLNTKVFALLDTQEGNKETEEKQKKGFFKRLFQ